MLLYHPPSPQCSQAFCATMELSKAASEHWTVKSSCKEPALAPEEEFEPLNRSQEEMVLTPFSWLWGEQSKPKYSSLQ